MKVLIAFDFHDVFVDAKSAWKEAFYLLSQNEKTLEEYDKGISKKIICEKYSLNYRDVEIQYRKLLKPIPKNIEFLKQLYQYYQINLISLSREDRLIKDLNKFKLKKYFRKIYSKEQIHNKKEILLELSKGNDWVVYFTHEVENITVDKNIVYIPIDFDGDPESFKNISYTEHAKTKKLYNELSKYYMNSIANDTTKEVNFLEEIFNIYCENKPKEILDCCCGVGRHDIKLAEKNFNVVGIDFSQSQIENAKKINSHKNIEYLIGDIRNFEINKKFPMVICMWTTYNYMSQEKDFVSFIHQVFKHQNSGDILLLDAKNIPKLKKHRVYRRENCSNNIEIDLLINKFIKKNTQNSQYFYFIKDNKDNNFYFDEEFIRFYYEEEIKELVKNYYSIEKVYGDFDGTSYSKNKSERFIIILKRK